MPHFHIPLQSGSDKILGRMRRRYKRDLYQKRISLIKEFIPDACIGVDVIVGFPGETEDEFMETYTFLSSLPVSYFHVFTYSERENTLAAEMDNEVPVPIRHIRNKRLRALSYEKQMKFEEVQRGKLRPVLFEKKEKGDMMEGYSDNYIRITTPYRNEWVNQVVDWKI